MSPRRRAHAFAHRVSLLLNLDAADRDRITNAATRAGLSRSAYVRAVVLAEVDRAENALAQFAHVPSEPQQRVGDRVKPR